MVREPIRILHLEGAAHEHRDLSRLLRADGFDARVVHRAADAAGIHADSVDQYDVVVADLDGDGVHHVLELMQRASLPELRILLTQRADPTLVFQAQSLGAVVLAKQDMRAIPKILKALQGMSSEASQDPVLAALGQLVDAVAVIDGAGTLCFVNRAFRVHSLLPAAALMGQPVSAWADAPAFLGAARKAIGAGSGVHSAISGNTSCSLMVHSIALGEARTAYVLRDVTLERHSEDTVQQLEDQLLHSQKMQSVAILASGIAHDFNNILTGIFGSAELARSELPQDHPAYADLDTIVHASRRAAELTKELLSYAHRGSRGTEIADLNQIVTSLLVILRSQVSRSIIVRKGLAPEVPAVEINIPKIQQVLMNLCINASEAMAHSGGILSIVTDLVHVGSDWHQDHAVGTLTPGNYATVEVADTGKGIEDGIRKRLFDPFFSTKEGHHGLGLAAAMRIVLEHRGALSVESRPGEGAVFRIYLPASAQAAHADAPTAAELDPQSRETILFVDDEEMLRALCQRGLEYLGYRVLLAADGIEAVRLHREHRSEIDLVVLDLSMPRKGGEEAYREMRALDPDVRVLLSCGYDEQAAGSMLSPDNLAGFLAKPFGMEELGAAVRRALSRKRNVRARSSG